MNEPAVHRIIDSAINHLSRAKRALRSAPISDPAVEERIEEAVKSLYRVRNALFEVTARGRRSCAGK